MAATDDTPLFCPKCSHFTDIKATYYPCASSLIASLRCTRCGLSAEGSGTDEEASSRNAAKSWRIMERQYGKEPA